MKLYFCRGYPGCGKSTLARTMVDSMGGTLVEVNRDTLRKAHKQWKRGRFSKTVEADVLKQRDELMKEALDKGLDVINSDTNLSPRHEAHFKAMAKKYGAQLECLDFIDPESPFYVPLEKCFKQDLLRDDSVGKDVILRMYYEKLAREVTPVEWDENLPDAIIVDLDGTLAHHEGLRGAFEEKYEVDSLDRSVLRIIQMADMARHRIIILSGREGTPNGRKQTLNWLEKHNIPYKHFYMRDDGDRRSDDIVKKEIYETHIKGKYNVIFCLDDRPRVVRAWESLGLKVFKCGPGMEF